MREETLKCDHCGKKVEHFSSEKLIGTIYLSEQVTYKHQVRLTVNQQDWNCDLCSDCIDVLRDRMEKIFDNKVWREVDKVYECRWDCKPMQREAA